MRQGDLFPDRQDGAGVPECGAPDSSEGHTIGTHTEDHPLRMQKLPVDKIRWEIDQGIADVGAALGDPNELAPFIRIPGLSRSPVIEEEAAARSLVIFSSEHRSPMTGIGIWRSADIVSTAMSRLGKPGKGILLLHDIHKSTVAALPELLKELKERGFRVVHVIPGDVPGRIQTVGEPPLADHTMLPVPNVTSFATAYLPKRRIVLADRLGRREVSRPGSRDQMAGADRSHTAGRALSNYLRRICRISVSPASARMPEPAE